MVFAHTIILASRITTLFDAKLVFYPGSWNALELFLAAWIQARFKARAVSLMPEVLLTSKQRRSLP